MSEQGEKILLAGHAPATIVGGMRVPGHHHHPKSQDINNNNNKTSESKTESEESFEQEQSERRSSSGNTVSVNGVDMKLNEAYPTESVKRMHEKPVPTHDKIQNRPNVPNHSGGIFQPRTGHHN